MVTTDSPPKTRNCRDGSGETREAVELALRRSHAELRFQIAAALETFRPSF